MNLTLKQRRGIVIAIVVLLTGYFWFTYSGPYMWLAELSLNWRGSYEPTFIGVLTGLVVLLPVALISEIPAVKRRFPLDLFKVPEGTTPGSPYNIVLYSDDSVIPWWPLGIGIICLGASLYYGSQLWTAGERTAITASQLEAGVRPSSGWLDVTGCALPSEAIHEVVKERGKEEETVFVPLVSSTWERGQPVYVYLDLGKVNRAHEAEARWSGRVAWSGLPGMIRESFNRSDAPPAEEYFLLDTTFNPREHQSMFVSLMVAGVFSFVVAAIRYPYLLHKRKIREGAGG
ncbi:MAG: hypothetical protein WD768_09985 [Phycisphaeraceae bacterium]